MRIIQTVLISLVVVGSIPMGYSIAQENNVGYKYLAIIKGLCTKLVVAGRDFTASCLPILHNTSYKIGRGSFAAILSSDQGIVSFSGSKDAQPSQSRYTLYLDKTLLIGKSFGSDTEPIYKNSTGTCDVFGNTLQEVSTIKCCTKSADGTIASLEFITDGTRPELIVP
jgi:hypothetical protein